MNHFVPHSRVNQPLLTLEKEETQVIDKQVPASASRTQPALSRAALLQASSVEHDIPSLSGDRWQKHRRYFSCRWR